MRQLDFYEFAGLVVPGTATLVALMIFFPNLWPMSAGVAPTLGQISVGAVLAYGAGHVVQALGNILESMWWRFQGGMPSDWVGKGACDFLHEKQLAALPAKISEQLGLIGVTLNGDSRWHGVTRQIYAAVSAAGRADRIDTFNGNYGLCRGLAASLLVVSLLTVLLFGFQQRTAILVTVSAFILCGWRAHRFGKHYARELFVQFLQLPTREAR